VFDPRPSAPPIVSFSLFLSLAFTRWQVRQVAEVCCGGRVVSILEGGYGAPPLHPSEADRRDPSCCPLDRGCFAASVVAHCRALAHLPFDRSLTAYPAAGAGAGAVGASDGDVSRVGGALRSGRGKAAATPPTQESSPTRETSPSDGRRPQRKASPTGRNPRTRASSNSGHGSDGIGIGSGSVTLESQQELRMEQQEPPWASTPPQNRVVWTPTAETAPAVSNDASGFTSWESCASDGGGSGGGGSGGGGGGGGGGGFSLNRSSESFELPPSSSSSSSLSSTKSSSSVASEASSRRTRRTTPTLTPTAAAAAPPNALGSIAECTAALKQAEAAKRKR